MRKIVPLTQISGGRTINSMIGISNNVLTVSPLPTASTNWSVNYDPTSGTLYVVRPDGTMVSTSGFETIYSIGVGPSGDDGISGTNGTDGINGIFNENGPQGARGNTGPQGYQGINGPLGLTGGAGGQGQYGLTGTSGNPGPQGIIGATGPQGQQGDRGNDGDIYLIFAETAPEYTTLPGDVWFEIRIRNFSAENRSSCSAPPATTTTVATTVTTTVPHLNSGFVAGGQNMTTILGIIQSLSYTTVTTDILNATLSVPRYVLTGVSSSLNAYYAGGDVAETVDSIDEHNFNTSACFQFVSSLTTTRDLLVGIQSQTVGYFAGGYNEANGYLSEIDALTFNSGSLRPLSVTLPSIKPNSRVSMASTGTNIDGYFVGGSTVSSLVYEIDNLNYASSAYQPIAARLTAAKSLMGSVCSLTDGYFGGGYTGTQINAIDVFNYHDKTCKTLTSTLGSTSQRSMSATKNSTAGMQSNTDGYFVGGYNGATPITIVDDISFGTDSTSTTCTAIDVVLTTATYNAASSSTTIPSL